MNITPSIGTYFSGSVRRPESLAQQAAPRFGSELEDIRKETEEREKRKVFEGVANTVLFIVPQKAPQEDQGKQITVGHVLADLFENHPQTIDGIKKGLPGFQTDLVKFLSSLRERGFVIKGDSDKKYGLSEEGVLMLQKACPNIPLPEEGVIYVHGNHMLTSESYTLQPQKTPFQKLFQEFLEWIDS